MYFAGKLLDTTQLIVMGGKKIYGKMGGVDIAVEDFRNLRPKNVRSRGVCINSKVVINVIESVRW